MKKWDMQNYNPQRPNNDLAFLPPALEHYEKVEILKQENRAVSAISELKGYAHTIPNQSILINAIVLQEAKDSSEIENIITTKDRLYKALSSNTKKMDAATKEVLHYREAINVGFKQICKNGFLSVNDILEIQQIIIGNDAGIRKTPGTTLFNDQKNQVIYTPPQGEDRINALMANFADYLNAKNGTLTRLAILHYQFEAIHPFYDGNGRTGRIVNILYLILNGYLDIPILYLSSYIIKNKSRYYDLLLTVTKKEDWKEWIVFILKGVEQTAQETMEKVKSIKNLLDKTIEEIREKLPKIYSKELVEALFVHPYCKTEFLVHDIGVERKAASRYLHAMKETGFLELQKIGAENIFVNTQLMEILFGRSPR